MRQDRKWTFLHDLAGRGRLDLCRLIVDRVDDKSPHDWVSHTPYHVAATEGHVELCQILGREIWV